LLTYSTSRGHVFLDRQLFLPEDWCDDAERRTRAKVPESVTFRTKPEQAGEMLEHAWKMGVPMQWVTGDSVYGCSPQLRQIIEQAGKWYALAVTSVMRVWTERPELLQPEEQTGGRPRRKVRLKPGAPKSQTVAEVIAALPKPRWRRLSIGVGTKGPRLYTFVLIRSAPPNLLLLFRHHHHTRLLPPAMLLRRWVPHGKQVASQARTFVSSLMERCCVLLNRRYSRMSNAEKPTGACAWCMEQASAVVVPVPCVSNASGMATPPQSRAK
jgi:hypothetical protein